MRFKWTEDCSAAVFQKKSKLITMPVLAYQYFRKSFILDIDDWDQSTDAVILQKNDGVEHAIAYEPHCEKTSLPGFRPGPT